MRLFHSPGQPQQLQAGTARGRVHRIFGFAVLSRMPDCHQRAGLLTKVKDLVRLLRRVTVTVTGIVIFAVGAVLLVAPGPGLLVIALALSVSAVEYRWARRYLTAVQERARSAALKAAASRVSTACTGVFGIGAVGLGAVLACTDLLPFPGTATGVSAAIGA